MLYLMLIAFISMIVFIFSVYFFFVFISFACAMIFIYFAKKYIDYMKIFPIILWIMATISLIGFFIIIQDIPYLFNPKQIIIKNPSIKNEKTYHIIYRYNVARKSRYYVSGKDEYGKTHTFYIGLDYKKVSKYEAAEILYLPNTSIIIDIIFHEKANTIKKEDNKQNKKKLSLPLCNLIILYYFFLENGLVYQK